ncbi:MAG TPA: zinc-ribbon and DUF3426 domain-containing protein [Gammaproteobacteria bacterium]
MLLTRCPECDTTFRVTDELLKKASGQVRCGRCASVFNAYAELQDSDSKPVEADAPRAQARTSATPTPRPEQPKPAPPPVRLETKRAENEGGASIGATVAAVVAEAKVAAADAAAEAQAEANGPDREAISATEVDRVLRDDLAAVPYVWLRTGDSPQSRWWSVAAALALLVLGAQAIHHFRSHLAGHPTFGPWVTAAYAKLGVQVAPNWDVRQYEIIDWVATAEPDARGLGSLKITARIQNHGPLRQPYPAVQLRLKDRYETKVGSRIFTPMEYLPRDTPHERLMSPGETARAEIEVVDPGPDAYGFELDVCIEVEASLVTCGTDEVFL